MNIVDQILTPKIRQAIKAPIAEASTLPRQAFISEYFAEAEATHIFAANWCALCFSELVAEPGDVLPIELAGMPLLIVRDEPGTLRVFHNIVPYDGCLAVIDAAQGLKEIRAPYHGWRYRLNGELLATPYWDGTIDGAEKKELGNRPGHLLEVNSVCWGPIVFVNIDGQAGAFEKAAESLKRAFDAWDIEALRIARGSSGDPILHPEDLKTNWKTYLENWGINVLHEAFVHNIYDQSPEVPRMKPDGSINFEDYVDGPLMSLRYKESDFTQTYPPLPFPELAKDPGTPTTYGYFGSFMPNFHFGVFSNMMHFIISLPDGPGRTITSRAQFYRAEAATDNTLEPVRQEFALGFVEAGQEDGRITEAVQRARRSPAFNSQYYSERWDYMHYRFSQWVIEQFEPS
ncbi:MAG: SRPBCC family protein [Pseudomonadota bacterium]